MTNGDFWQVSSNFLEISENSKLLVIGQFYTFTSSRHMVQFGRFV